MSARVVTPALIGLLTSVCLAATGNSLITTAVSLRLGRAGADASTLSLVLSAYPVGFLIGCLTAATFVAHLGHRIAFQLAVAVGALAGVAYVGTADPVLWSGFRFVNGLMIATIFIVVESWMNLYAEAANRGFLFSLYMLMTSLATFISQLVVTAAGAASPHLFAVAAVILASAFVLSLVTGTWPALPVQPSDDARSPSAAERGRALLRLGAAAPATLVAVLLSGMTNMNVYALLPVYGFHIGLSAGETVTLLTLFSVGGLLAQTPVGWLSDRISRRAILLAQGLLSVAACATIIALGHSAVPPLLAIFFIYGAVALTVYPVGIAFANAHLDRQHMVSAAGALLLLYSVGNVCTPSLAATLMTHVAPSALFLLLGSGAAVLALVAGLDRLLRKRLTVAAAPHECLAGGLDR